MRPNLAIGRLAGILLLSHLPVPGTANAEETTGWTVLSAAEFGVVADGTADDGPAIQRMIARARDASGPVELRFPGKRVIHVGTGSDRYAFRLDDLQSLRIDGNGSEFRLAPHLRFIRAERCRNLTITGLAVDFVRQPTVPGTITAVDAVRKFIDVRLDDPDLATELGGPTKEDGEQAFFGMILLKGFGETTTLRHFYVDAVTHPSRGIVKVTNDKTDWRELRERVEPGRTRIDLPVPGIAHRYGPGSLFDIRACGNVNVLDVDVWSAPWFTFRLSGNEGTVSLKRVAVRPKPGSVKVLSSCRDAIHAKGNRGSLLFEDCVLDGLGDDAFNLSTHCSGIRAIKSPVEIVVSQEFPLEPIPFRVGDTVIFMDPANNRKVAERIVRSVKEIPSTRKGRDPSLQPWAPSSLLGLDRPVDAVGRVGLVVWSRESANPVSVIRRCVIKRSCRFQTPVVVEDCDVQALLWCYGARIEGPGPESVAIRHSRLRANEVPDHRANSLIISGWEGSRGNTDPTPEDAVLKRVELTGNEIHGRVRIVDALEVELDGNRIVSPDGPPVTFQHCGRILGE